MYHSGVQLYVDDSFIHSSSFTLFFDVMIFSSSRRRYVSWIVRAIFIRPSSLLSILFFLFAHVFHVHSLFFVKKLAR